MKYILPLLLILLCPGICVAEEADSSVTDLTQEEVLIDLTEAQQVQTLVVNNLVMPPTVEEEEEEIITYSLSSQESLENIPNENVLIYKGTFDGDDYYLILPVQYESSLFVTEGGILTNVSGSNIVGRLFDSDQFVVTDYDYTLFTLSSVLVNAGATATYRYGYPSYMTEYSQNSTGMNLTSENTYGNFYVTEQIAADETSTEYDIFLLLLVLVIIQGFMLIFSWLRIAKN